MKIFALFSFSVILCLAITELALRLTGFEPAHAWEEQNLLIVKPDSFFLKDNNRGWKIGGGVFDTYLNDKFIFRCTTDKGKRITHIAGLNDSTHVNEEKKKIFITGCSYTFGYSVPDTGNYPFYLQHLLPNYEIENIAVPGYGLTQMYLSLKQEVEKGNKPELVIINYATWQDERAALGLNWLRSFRYAVMQSAPIQNHSIAYPFCRLTNNDSLIIDYLEWNKWYRDFPLRDKLAMVDLINTSFDKLYDKRKEATYGRVSLKCSRKIIDYCSKNKIKVAFYGLNYDSKNLLDSLKLSGVVTKLSSVNVSDSGYNCAPLDPGHPSPKAHQLYSKEVFDVITSAKLIE